MPRPRNAGEIGVATWLMEILRHIGAPAPGDYENGRVPSLLSREGADVVAVATDYRSHSDSKSCVQPDHHRSGEVMNVVRNEVHPAIDRYAARETSATEAAGLLGGDCTVAEVIVVLRQAGLKPPEPPPERQAAEWAQAKRVLGLV